MVFYNIFSDIFSLGFGPFRWVCTSADPADLAVTDNITLQVLDRIIAKGGESFLPLSLCQSVSASVPLSVCLSVSLSVPLSVCLSVCWSFCSSLCLSVLSVGLSVPLSVSLSVGFSFPLSVLCLSSVHLQCPCVCLSLSVHESLYSVLQGSGSQEQLGHPEQRLAVYTVTSPAVCYLSLLDN